MINLKKLTIDDIDIIRKYICFARCNSADYTVGQLIAWSDYLNYKYAIIDETLVINLYMDDIGSAWYVPIGKNVDDALNVIYNDYKNINDKLYFVDVTNEDEEVLRQNFIVESKIVSDWSDYVYNAIDLIKLVGRKYCHQRNHINYFITNYKDYSFDVMSDNNIKEVLYFLEKFGKENDAGSITFVPEMISSKMLIENRNIFNFNTLILKVSNEIVGISLGEIVNDTLFIHIEKANRNVRGAYPVLMQEFAKRYALNLKYINREDSGGDEGLATSKKRYNPCKILEKCIVNILDKK